MTNRVYVVGVGPGNSEMISSAGIKIIDKSDILIGGKRNLEIFEHLKKEKYKIEKNLQDIIKIINEKKGFKKIVVLSSGDPNIYGIAEFLKNNLKECEISVIPSISSIQYLAAKSMTSLNDAYITSVHGRDNNNLLKIVKENKKVALFTDSKNSPQSLCKMFCKRGLKNLYITIGENLSYENEKVTQGTLEELKDAIFDSLSVMIIENKDNYQYNFLGIPDSMFIRGNVPMTKEEVRTVSISKLKLTGGSIVYDIGAGTGSVSVECALLAKEGLVYAIEKNSDAVDIINKNIEKFGLLNVNVIEEEAPFKIDELPPAQNVFIGGTGGNMDEIICWIAKKCDKVRIVINAITPESTYEALKSLEDNGFSNIEITGISVSKGIKAGEKHIMKALNPVNIICGDLGGE
ncbi:precorrin-6y C5,15-methyltransferase (decarboxylating) subunit CbiE [Herbivorax sp. ANBcel31]|uniref:precorrin-6y C5,15-methyltransferase (decarboxylating) subunit CbiE n=1 Tax=Herbivorax sp. ANBcel31 TaxID=3069754 RepID=UPI0027B00E39|nr:precorrin-6y C5,15-methyltransferase (decarboxylating) subunit CbiE [Herbivorax sp. ANBcel31]MDQ2086944.1 precorrin-6y C5,15-methyltransferase (decarboxylating) subunit CbiE [Herbivorax sp. ANBcel31]